MIVKTFAKTVLLITLDSLARALYGQIKQELRELREREKSRESLPNANEKKRPRG